MMQSRSLQTSPAQQHRQVKPVTSGVITPEVLTQHVLTEPTLRASAPALAEDQLFMKMLRPQQQQLNNRSFNVGQPPRDREAMRPVQPVIASPRMTHSVNVPVAPAHFRASSYEPPRSRHYVRQFAPGARSRSGTPIRQFFRPFTMTAPTVEGISRVAAQGQPNTLFAQTQASLKVAASATPRMFSQIPTPARRGVAPASFTPQAPKIVHSPVPVPVVHIQTMKEISSPTSLCSTMNRVAQAQVLPPRRQSAGPPSETEGNRAEFAKLWSAVSRLQSEKAPCAQADAVASAKTADLTDTIQVSNEDLKARLKAHSEVQEKERLQEATQELEATKQKLSELESENSMLESEKVNYVQELQTRDEKLRKSEETNRKLEGLKRSLEYSFEQRIAKKQQEIEEQREKIKDMERNFEEARLREEKQQREASRLQEQLKDVEMRSRTALDDATQQYRSDMNAMQERHNEELQKRESILAQYQAELDDQNVHTAKLRAAAHAKDEAFVRKMTPGDFIAHAKGAGAWPPATQMRQMKNELADSIDERDGLKQKLEVMYGEDARCMRN